ncbi:hypothetical protein BH23BAC2_BH23BAC2_12590 [soil metagenome]
MDAIFTHKDIPEIGKRDPMLARPGALSAKKMYAENGDLDEPNISPNRGSYAGFPKILVFIAGDDICTPDMEITIEQFIKHGIDQKIVGGKGMPPIWPILPLIKQGRCTFNEMITEINSKI